MVPVGSNGSIPNIDIIKHQLYEELLTGLCLHSTKTYVSHIFAAICILYIQLHISIYFPFFSQVDDKGYIIL